MVNSQISSTAEKLNRSESWATLGLPFMGGSWVKVYSFYLVFFILDATLLKLNISWERKSSWHDLVRVPTPRLG